MERWLGSFGIAAVCGTAAITGTGCGGQYVEASVVNVRSAAAASAEVVAKRAPLAFWLRRTADETAPYFARGSRH